MYLNVLLEQVTVEGGETLTSESLVFNLIKIAWRGVKFVLMILIYIAT